MDIITQSEAEQCAICLEPMESQQRTFKTHCNHTFHQTCLWKWNDTCALCRSELSPHMITIRHLGIGMKPDLSPENITAFQQRFINTLNLLQKGDRDASQFAAFSKSFRFNTEICVICCHNYTIFSRTMLVSCTKTFGPKHTLLSTELDGDMMYIQRRKRSPETGRLGEMTHLLTPVKHDIPNDDVQVLITDDIHQIVKYRMIRPRVFLLTKEPRQVNMCHRLYDFIHAE